MQEARDDVFCHLIARRSVARAALHLGIDAMSQEALDALSGVLLAYLERVGKALAYSVESSGRSSAHCHAIDALRAVELCTAAAVQRVHIVASGVGVVGGMTARGDDVDEESAERVNASVIGGGGSGVGGGTGGGSVEAAMDVSWKGLAAFCFGPDWHIAEQQQQQTQQLARPIETSLENNTEINQNNHNTTTTINTTNNNNNNHDHTNNYSAPQTSGKVGPSALLTGAGGDVGTRSIHNRRGWNAPYPDELLNFPATLHPTAMTAHPHALPLSVTESLHTTTTTMTTVDDMDHATMNTNPHEMPQTLQNELDDLPDNFLISKVVDTWGSLDKEKMKSRIQPALMARGKNEATALSDKPSGATVKPVAGSAATSITGASATSTLAAGASSNTTTPNPKRKADDKVDDMVDSDMPPAKKVKMADFSGNDKKPDGTDKIQKKKSDVNDQEEEVTEGAVSDADIALGVTAFLPIFFPRYPKASDSMGRTVMDADWVNNKETRTFGTKRDKEDKDDDTSKKKNQSKSVSTDIALPANLTDPALQVRSALVSLGQHYWGSGWDEHSSNEEASEAASANLTNLVVPQGRTGTDTSIQPQIVPLGRASGSRVSRILEGSMDPTNPA